jgi:hypothetical protein
MSTANPEGPRIAITEDNRSALIVVVTATLLAWTVGVLFVRLASKLTSRIRLDVEEAIVISSSVRSTTGGVFII